MVVKLKSKWKFGLAVVAISCPMVASAAIVATVGEKQITDDQLKMDFDSMTSEQRKAVNQDVNTKRNLVENAVNAEILVQAAKKAGLDKDEDYKKALERFQRQFLASRFMAKAVEPKLTTGETKKFFEKNKNFFDSTEVCAFHIVMDDEGEAKKIAGLAKGKGVKFDELAKKHSLDPTVQENKGNLGCFPRDKMVPEFAIVAFDMKKGEIRGPVRTMYGYHVIKVTDIKAGKTPGYDEIEQRVKEAYRMKLVTELINDLRTKSSVKVNDEAVKNFKL